MQESKRKKDDEFYTRLENISQELQFYNLSGKVVYCPCDNPSSSMFWKYFKDNFKILNLKRVICTHLGSSYKTYYDGNEVKTERVENFDGDFRNDNFLNILEECDVVVTNPPFSLFRDFFSLLLKQQKRFLILGNILALSTKIVFPFFKRGEVHLGENVDSFIFDTPTGEKKLGNICWYTNLSSSCSKKFISLSEHFDDIRYQFYDNYEAINVPKVKDIPDDYDGFMGVPLSYIQKHNSEQFELIGIGCGSTTANGLSYEVPHVKMKVSRGGVPVINGKRTAPRLFIKKK